MEEQIHRYKVASKSNINSVNIIPHLFNDFGVVTKRCGINNRIIIIVFYVFIAVDYSIKGKNII